MANEPQIKVYDNIFSYEEQVNLYNFIKGCLFQMCSADDSAIEHNEDYSMVSSWSLVDIENFGILKNNKVKEILEGLGHIEQMDGRVNVSFPSDSDRFHIDGAGAGEYKVYTLLYYPNLNWNLEWGGHLILSKDRKKIDKVVEYVPGRVVLLPGDYPHLIFSPTKLAKSPRFSFSLHLKVLPE